MKAAELRIGNWIQSSSNKEYQINLSWYECCKDSTEGRDIQLDTFPIPLTEEWLIKFGFDGQDYNLFTIELSRNQFMMLKDEWLNVISNNCKYVHQLQNLYFAITGEELTIK